MKKPIFMLAMSLVLVSSVAQAAEEVQEMSPIIREEFRKAQADLMKDLNAAKKKLADIESAKTTVVTNYDKQATAEVTWASHLKKLDLLFSARYVDDKGEYKEALELSAHDVEIVNKLFDDYLKTRPIRGRATVGQARKILEDGQERLKDLAKMHKSPSEANNAEFAIMALQKQEAEKQIRKITTLAEKLGFDMNQNAVAEGGRDAGRAPATE